MNYIEIPAIGTATREMSEADITLINKVMSWLQQTEGSECELLWQDEAEEDYAFYGGDQDSQTVLQKLADAKRPATTYNEIKPKVDVVVGLANQNRQLPTAYPTNSDKDSLVELANGAIKYFRRETKLAENEVTCFEHTVKSGRSLLHFFVDDENPFEPNIKTRFVHGRDFKLDPRSVCYDMSDARFIFIDFWYDKEEILVKYPNFDPELVSQLQGAVGLTGHSYPFFYNAVNDTYRITECWYKQTEEVYWIKNPITKEDEKVSPETFKAMREALQKGIQAKDGTTTADPDFQGIKRYATVYRYVIFSNYYIFEQGRSKHRWEGFPCVLFGAFRHDTSNRWFSFISIMKDPQRGINTMRRQMQHLLQTAPKGILIHEVGAILDIEAYESKSAEPNYHMEVAQGALDKVKFTDQPTISPVYGQLMQEDKQFMKDGSGIQNDTLGIQTYSREPGITTQLRQGQNIAILYILLNNFKQSRLVATKLLFSMVQQYVSTERIIRIEGSNGLQLLKLNTQSNPNHPDFNDITIGKYDFYVDEGIETVNSRNSIAQMLVDINQQAPGSVPPELIVEYAGAPFSVVQKLKQYQQSMQQSQMQAEKEKEATEIQLEMAKLENQKFIAVINNLTKLVTSDKKIEGDVLGILLSGIQQKEAAKVAQPKQTKKEN